MISTSPAIRRNKKQRRIWETSKKHFSSGSLREIGSVGRVSLFARLLSNNHWAMDDSLLLQIVLKAQFEVSQLPIENTQGCCTSLGCNLVKVASCGLQRLTSANLLRNLSRNCICLFILSGKDPTEIVSRSSRKTEALKLRRNFPNNWLWVVSRLIRLMLKRHSVIRGRQKEEEIPINFW